jgi:sugar phosphate isomerase/epimerase
MASLALDHITVVDTTPAELAAVAAQTGCDGICIFLHSMPDALPRLPAYNLITDVSARRETRKICADLGVAIDLAYPFTLASRTNIADFAPALEASADLGAPVVNALLYDRDPVRRLENFGAFCDLAGGYGLEAVVEFYPPSQIKSLADVLTLLRDAGRGNAGINLDLLHHVRSGGGLDELICAPAGAFRLVQLSDGPASIAEDKLVWEAGMQRLLPGAGALPLRNMLAQLPAKVRLSVEVPQEELILAGLGPLQRAKRAVDAALQFLPR